MFKQGFKDFTDERDKKKGKKNFKFSNNSKKKIYFDYINIEVINESRVMHTTYNLTENQFKIILMYFKLNTTDFKEFTGFLGFQILEAEKKLNKIRSELKKLQEINYKILRQRKLNRIIDFFDNIKL